LMYVILSFGVTNIHMALSHEKGKIDQQEFPEPVCGGHSRISVSFWGGKLMKGNWKGGKFFRCKENQDIRRVSCYEVNIRKHSKIMVNYDECCWDGK
jgi:hypothetical protein